MARTIRSIRGGKQVVAETVAKGLGQGALASPRADWTPTSVGMKHDLGNVGMRESVQASLAAAYGVHPAMFNPSATAPGMLEIKRLAFLNCTLPLSKAIADELTTKLETPISIRYLSLADQSVDVHLRVRAAQAVGQLGVTMEDALVIGGLDGVVLANDEDDLFRMMPPLSDARPPGQQHQGVHRQQHKEPRHHLLDAPQDAPQDPRHLTEGRATGLILSHLEDGKVIKQHDVDSPCELCKSRTTTNGRMEYRNS